MTQLGLVNFTYYLFAFTFRCMNALALSWTPSISSLYFLFTSICFCDLSLLRVRCGGGQGGGGGCVLRKANENEHGEVGQTYLYVHHEKNCPIFWTANSVLSDKLLSSC